MKQRGDTIVEVLFSMVVIGLSLAAAFGIANRSLQISRSSQDRTEAQKIAESQIELIKLVLSSETAPPGIKNPISNASARNFCLARDNSGVITKKNNNQDECQIVNQLDSGVDYSVNIDTQREGSTVTQYEVTVTWDRVGTSSDERGTLTLYYRPGYISGYTPSVGGAGGGGGAGAVCSNGILNLSDYAINYVSSDPNVAVNVVDVAYLGDLYTGPPPRASIVINQRSDPDIILNTNQQLETVSGCNYQVQFIGFCTSNLTAFGTPPSECGFRSEINQLHEQAYLKFYTNYTGNSTNARCTGQLIAETLTTDLFITNSDVIESGNLPISILRNDRVATCLELEHVCVRTPALCANTTSRNSVYIHRLSWSAI